MFGVLTAIVAFVVANYIPVLGFYLLGGVVYAVLKWVLKAVILRSEIAAYEQTLTATEAKDKQAHRERLTSKVFGQYAYPPKVSNAKGKLFGWALFWPINLVWTMFADVARNVWLWLYNTFGSVLQKLSDKILPKD